MNRTDRLLAIILELQRKKRGYYRAKDLAETFEVSQRTIYRDMLALREIGVPVYAAEREGYALVDGYFLPPLSFTVEEALTIALGNEFMAKIFDDQLRAAANSAYRKIDVVLQANQRNQVDIIKSRFHIDSSKQLKDKAQDHLRKLRKALIEQNKIRLIYSRWDHSSETIIKTIREVNPYNLTRMVGAWYLEAYCHLRKSVRVFRLSRIEQVDILEATYEFPEEEFSWTEKFCEKPLFIQAIFDIAIVSWMKESSDCSIIEEEKTLDGILISFITEEKTDLVGWLLRYGGRVRVLEPEWLQTELTEHAKRILRNYDQIPVLADR